MNNEESKKILNISLSKANLLEQKDRLVWPFSPDGQNQTRIAYQISLALTFTWKILREAIPLNLSSSSRRHFGRGLICVCWGDTDTFDHLFMHCPFTKVVWSRLQLGVNTFLAP